MEHAAFAGTAGFAGVPLGRCAAVAAGWCIVLPLWAQEASPQPQDFPLAEARADAGMQVEVNASALPRLDAQPRGFQAPRIDFSVLPATGNGLGVAVGMSGFSAGARPAPSGHPAVRPSLDLGLTFRHVLRNDKQIDVTAWRRMPAEPDAYTLVQMREPMYGARVEMALSPARKSGLSFERGFIGLQLEGGGKISIKRRNGRPMIYYRTSF